MTFGNRHAPVSPRAVALLVWSLTLIAASAAAFAEEGVAGRWYGWGSEQPLRAGVPTRYPICIALDGANAGRIDYPTLRCGGSLARTGGDPARAVFREHISYGDCINGGEVILRRGEGKLSFTWRGSDGATFITVTALLEPIAASATGNVAGCALPKISDARRLE